MVWALPFDFIGIHLCLQNVQYKKSADRYIGLLRHHESYIGVLNDKDVRRNNYMTLDTNKMCFIVRM